MTPHPASAPAATPAQPRNATADLSRLRIDRSGEDRPSRAGPFVLGVLLGIALGVGGLVALGPRFGVTVGVAGETDRGGAAAPGSAGGGAGDATAANRSSSGTSPAGASAGGSTPGARASSGLGAAGGPGASPGASAGIGPGSGASGSAGATAAAGTGSGEERPMLSASGYVIARREAEVGAKVSGRLVWLGIDAGSRVTEGEVIARLEDADVQADLDVARASLERAEKSLARVEGSPLGSSADQRDAALADVKVWRARVALSEARLADTRIRAPFAGVVTQKRAEVGETVSPLATTGQLTPTGIAHIVDFSTIEGQVDVSERYVKRLALGQPVLVEVTAFPGRRFRGELRQVIPASSREKAVVETRVKLLEGAEELLPGMGIKVTFLERS